MDWYVMRTEGLSLHQATAYACVSPERQRRADAHAHAEGKRGQIAAGLLERFALGKAADARTENAYGKPMLADGRDYSLSHTIGAVALAVDDARVGVDIEWKRPIDERVVRRFFRPEEQAYVYGQRDFSEAFTMVFTRKEAVVKALGLGLSQPLDSFSVLDTEVLLDGARIYLHTQQVGKWYLSLASERDVEWTGRELDWEDAMPIRRLRT